MSQERKIDDKDLKNVSGGGPRPKDLEVLPGQGRPAGRGTPPPPPTGGGGHPNLDEFEAEAENIPGQGPIDFGR